MCGTCRDAGRKGKGTFKATRETQSSRAGRNQTNLMWEIPFRVYYTIECMDDEENTSVKVRAAVKQTGTIWCPHVDCTESMRRRELGTYSRFLPALEAERVGYKPVVWSCWGREHPDTTAVLTQLARQAAGVSQFVITPIHQPKHHPLVELSKESWSCIGSALPKCRLQGVSFRD